MPMAALGEDERCRMIISEVVNVGEMITVACMRNRPVGRGKEGESVFVNQYLTASANSMALVNLVNLGKVNAAKGPVVIGPTWDCS